MINFTKYLWTPLFLSLLVFSVHAQTTIRTEADQMPFFPGCQQVDDKRSCSNNNLIRFIGNQLIYPPSAKDQGIEGTVYVAFVIDENGKVDQANVIRDIGGGCGAAALDVINSMPSWEPAIHDGQPVKVELRIPILFSLKNSPVYEKGQNYQINWGSLATQVSITKQELQNQFNKSLHVRDPYGDDKPVTELIFAFERKKSYLEGSSAGKINDEMKKVINKCKKGGLFTITAVIQVNGELIYVKRAFEVI